jgi:NAD(P)-dependent dehydrogenase (short-subunit alcohol dehydrogenase family)
MPAAIVTGAAAGNGLAIAQKLRASRHFTVALDQAPIPADLADVPLTGDVLDASLMQAVFDAACAVSDKTVFLVNNAGITRPGVPQSDAAWESTVDVNLTAPFRWARAFSLAVQEGKIQAGGIVFIGSLATMLGFPENPAYQASKSGVLGLTRAFAYDLGPKGIRVNCVSPGYIATAMTERSYNDPALNAARRRHMLLPRWGRPEDVANAVAFLCSPESGYITGINLPVDGGWAVCGLSHANPENLE